MRFEPGCEMALWARGQLAFWPALRQLPCSRFANLARRNVDRVEVRLGRLRLNFITLFQSVFDCLGRLAKPNRDSDNTVFALLNRAQANSQEVCCFLLCRVYPLPPFYYLSSRHVAHRAMKMGPRTNHSSKSLKMTPSGSFFVPKHRGWRIAMADCCWYLRRDTRLNNLSPPPSPQVEWTPRSHDYLAWSRAASADPGLAH